MGVNYSPCFQWEEGVLRGGVGGLLQLVVHHALPSPSHTERRDAADQNNEGRGDDFRFLFFLPKVDY
jgi:hypothetical protein